MANSLYAAARQHFLQGDIDWINDNIKVALVSGSYIGGSQGIDNDSTYADLGGNFLSATQNTVTLTNKASVLNSVLGVAVADPVTFTAVVANQTIAYLVIFKDPDVANIDGPPADPASAPLIALFDSGYGIGAGTNGGNILITWDVNNGLFHI